MTTDIVIIEKEIGTVIEIEENLPLWKMILVMGRDYKKIFDYLAAHKCASVEMPYARYVDLDWEVEISKGPLASLLDLMIRKWHFYAGIGTAAPLPGEGTLKPGTIPRARYVQARHVGPYHKVGPTYKKMYKWLKEQGLSAKNEAFEFYLNDPRQTKKEDLETIILIPLA